MSDTESEQLEIKLDGEFPLSKKELRKIKKGKTTLEELQKKKAKKLAKATKSADPTPSTQENQQDTTESTDNTTTITTGPKRSEFGVWIGNLSFETTRDELSNFIISKSDGKISKNDISRINLPTRGTKNRGFAYVDFNDENILNVAISLSEELLNGRKLLIKNAKSYEGRPEKPTGLTATVSKNPPSRILFVGNLSFDTTEDLIRDHFKHCGEIVKIRMATFEDSGKCKGFAFIDFKDVEGPTMALKDRNTKKLIGRPLRLEFGEDRSQRKVVPKRNFEESNQSTPTETPVESYSEQTQSRGFQPKQDKSFKRQQFNRPEKRMTSSVALANAPRQSAAIVKSTGKKLTFD